MEPLVCLPEISGEGYFVESFFAFGALAEAGSDGVFFGGAVVGFTSLVNFLCLTFMVSITVFFALISAFVIHAVPGIFLPVRLRQA